MNFIIEHLNAWGEPALAAAWAMLWQSSLLIALLLALEWSLGRKLRPGFRYLLWLIVLMKLVLPPSLALPTGVAWWVRPQAKTVRPVHDASVLVTYGSTAAPMISTAVLAPQLRKPALSFTGTALAGSAGVSLALFAFLLVRWRQVARLSAADGGGGTPGWLSDLLDQARHSVGVRRPVALRLVQGPMSPALLGLVRPVILLPESLLQRLSPAQLRPVLLHELIHLRRGDLWVNCAQALLQIVYWWHPLVWVTNHRIRRDREEAVDEAVMLALRNDAETYAPTLLEVARLAVRRPLAGLGIMGILESPGALRHRIERLLDFRPPQKSHVAITILCAATFGALALPMGEAPALNPGPEAAKTNATSPAVTSPGDSVGGSKTAEVGVLVQDGKLLFQMGKLDEAEKKFVQAVQQDRQHQAASYYLNLIKEARYEKSNEPPPLYSRMIKVDPHTFLNGLRSVAGKPETEEPQETSKLLRDFFASVNVDLSPPKSIFYSDREGTILIRATLQDLDVIETAVHALNLAPPQLNIKARFVEMSETEEAEFWMRHPGAAQTPSGVRMIQLASGEAQKQLADWTASSRAEVLGQPSITTLSGRQAQVQFVELKNIVTFTNAPSPHWETNANPFGPILDVLPTLSTDTFRFDLAIKASITEFLGYDDPGELIDGTQGGQMRDPIPRFRIRQLPVTATVWDGHALVIGGSLDEQNRPADKPGDNKKRRLLMIIPTVIDPAGNRLHSDEEVQTARARNGSPIPNGLRR